MIIVTGANGFIGKYVGNELSRNGIEYISIVRNRKKINSSGRIIEADLADYIDLVDKLSGIKIEACIHLAWEGIPDYSYEVSEKNLIIGLNILRLCRELHIDNLVISGSCWEYDNPEGSIRTDHAVQYNDAFKAAKDSLHMMASSFCREYGIHLNWLRLFYVFGQGQRKGSLIPYIIDCFRRGIKPELNGAYNENDFIYAGDVADAIVKVSLNHGYKETLNVGSGKATKVLDIVRYIADKFDFDEKLLDYPVQIGRSFYADEEEMKDSFGWSPQTDIYKGIDMTIESM